MLTKLSIPSFIFWPPSSPDPLWFLVLLQHSQVLQLWIESSNPLTGPGIPQAGSAEIWPQFMLWSPGGELGTVPNPESNHGALTSNERLPYDLQAETTVSSAVEYANIPSQASGSTLCLPVPCLPCSQPRLGSQFF